MSTCIYLMQGSDVGFLPMGQSIPACDTSTKVISRLEYHIYRQCVSYDNLGEGLLFNAVQDMLNPLNSTKVGIRSVQFNRAINWPISEQCTLMTYM